MSSTLTAELPSTIAGVSSIGVEMPILRAVRIMSPDGSFCARLTVARLSERTNASSRVTVP